MTVKHRCTALYLKKLISVLCHWGCKQHLHITVGDAIKQHFLNISVGLSNFKEESLKIQFCYQVQCAQLYPTNCNK